MTRRRWILLAVVIVLLVAVGLWWWYQQPVPLRFPGYELDLSLPTEPVEEPAALSVGLAAVDITPDLDRHRIYLAGFEQGRKASGVHDPLWARALVLDDGTTRVGIVALDLIAHTYDDTISLRQAASPLGLDYLLVCSTHNHNSPDTMGIWGPSSFERGVDEDYMKVVWNRAALALGQACERLQPARLTVATVATGTEGLVRDSRRPVVIDDELLVMRFDAPEGASSKPLGTLTIWSCHPESLGSENHLVTSDYVNYLRQSLEQDPGGTSMFLVGSVGGLMTQLGLEVVGPDGEKEKGNTFRKAELQGRMVAKHAREALAGPRSTVVEEPRLRLRARTIRVPMDNPRLYAAGKLGLVDRGVYDGIELQSEVGVLGIGPVDLLLVPGEIYPELVIGGIERAEGADFPDAPLEEPPLKELSQARFKAVVGMANDELGYLLPKAGWDAKAPWLYGSESETYGEINSLGPEAGPTVYRALAGLLEEARDWRQPTSESDE